MNLFVSQHYTDEIKQIKKPRQIANRHFDKASMYFIHLNYGRFIKASID
jgi:hypothetical protein